MRKIERLTAESAWTRGSIVRERRAHGIDEVALGSEQIAIDSAPRFSANHARSLCSARSARNVRAPLGNPVKAIALLLSAPPGRLFGATLGYLPPVRPRGSGRLKKPVTRS